MLGMGQLLVIAMIVFVIFGAGKLPTVMGEIGKGIKNFKDNLQGDGNNETQGENKKSQAATKAMEPKLIKQKTSKAKPEIAPKRPVVKKAKTSSGTN